MSKVFFFNIPFHGHVNPSLGLAQELVKKGEKVIYYGIDSFKEKIESTGAEFRSYGDKFYLDDNFVTYNLTELFKVHMELTELIMDKLLQDIEKDKPDYIVHDSLATWGKCAAAAAGIPAIDTFTTLVLAPDGFLLTVGFVLSFAMAMITNIPNVLKIQRIRKNLKKKYNVHIESLVDILCNRQNLNLVYTSDLFQPNREALGNEYKFIGPTSMFRKEAITRFNIDRRGNRPLLFISMGTIFNNNREFFDKCTEAFVGMELDVLMSVGKNINISSLSIPENFTVKPYNEIPQLEVLKECSIFMTHGGMNSTHEGLYNGVPLIIIPQQQEQAHVAMQVVRTKSGICLKNSQITPALLKQSVEKIMSDHSYRENALKMRDSFIDAGGPEKGVEEIFAYISKTKIISSVFSIGG